MWLQRLIDHHEIWNGRKLISVPTVEKKRDRNHTDIGLFNRKYRDRLENLGYEIFEVKNSKKLRETVQFIDLIRKLKTENPNEVFCNMHTKGVTHAHYRESTTHEWGELMWQTVILNWKKAIESLNGHACTGSFKRHGAFSTPGNNRWHYSGTFYWIRLIDLFRREWEYVDQHFYGTESYVGSHFKSEEAACLFLDQCQDPYKEDYWRSTVNPEFEKWRQNNEA